MKIVGDTHTHTIASTHAYSTIDEMAKAASKKGLEFICMTDHGVGAFDAPHIWHFENMRVLPEFIEKVRIFKGVEANIITVNGDIDMPHNVLSRLDWTIASFHHDFEQSDFTNAWFNVIENPMVDVLGHMGNENYDFNFEKVLSKAKLYDKIVEINSASFLVRPGSEVRCKKIAEICKDKGIRIVVSSDAHSCYGVGDFDKAVKLLEQIDFPEELIVNSDMNKMLKHINEKKNRRN